MMRDRNLLDSLLTGILMLCAIAITGLIAKRELFPGTMAGPDVRPFPDGARFAATGHSLGNPESNNKMVVFSDFECPACRQFATVTLPWLLKRFPGRIDIRYRHWPLSYHPNAMQAARAAACSDRQGYFKAYHDYLFQNPGKLGVDSYVRFAARVGIPDTTSFSACLDSEWADSLVANDMAAVEELDSRGTPTLLLGGMQVSGIPDSTMLVNLLGLD